MADNLTVTIGADSSKLRAELALVNQATKAANKELANLAAAFTKTGTSADRINLDAKARQLDQYKRSAVSLKQQIAELSPTFNKVGASAEHAASGLQEFVHQGRGLGRVLSEFSTLTRGVESLGGIFGKLAGGFGGGLAGVALGKGFSFLREQLDEVSKSLTELRKNAGDIGTTPVVLKAAQNAVKALGQDADVATDAFKGMSAQLDEIRKKSTQGTGAGGVSILRGGRGTQGVAGAPGVQVFRGGVPEPRDFSKPLEMLGIAGAIAAQPNNQLGEKKSYLLMLQAFMAQAKNFDPTALNMLSKALFGGRSADTMKEAAPAIIRELEPEIARLQKELDDAFKRNEELLKSRAALAKSWDDMLEASAASAVPIQIAVNAVLADIITKVSDGSIPAAFAATWNEFTSGIATQSASAWTAFLAGAQTAADQFKTIWQSTLDWLSTATSTVVAAVKSTADAIGNAATSGVPFAAGGLVRGGGTGTSDSIMARLSNGEFVMRAAAVQHWGPQLLASLNSLRNPGFALGGLVSTQGFAAGGLVAAGGGTPVHLHLGGNSFALSGHDNVVTALVVEAHRQQMRSAGTKPSWFAARPGG